MRRRRRLTRLLEVDRGASRGDGLAQELGIVRRASGNEGEPFRPPGRRGGGDLAKRFVELHRVLLLGLLSEFREFRSARTGRSGAEEPRFDDVAKPRGRTFPPEHLHGVVPSHPAEGGAATDEDHLGLIVGGGGASHCFWYLCVVRSSAEEK